MAIIDVSQARAGMILAADVHDKRGRMLIPAGKELVERYLGAFPQWGVTRIEVEGDDVGGDEDLEPWAVERATEEIDRLFSRSNRTHPALEALAGACVARKAALIQANEQPPESA